MIGERLGVADDPGRQRPSRTWSPPRTPGPRLGVEVHRRLTLQKIEHLPRLVVGKHVVVKQIDLVQPVDSSLLTPPGAGPYQVLRNVSIMCEERSAAPGSELQASQGSGLQVAVGGGLSSPIGCRSGRESGERCRRRPALGDKISHGRKGVKLLTRRRHPGAGVELSSFREERGRGWRAAAEGFGAIGCCRTQNRGRLGPFRLTDRQMAAESSGDACPRPGAGMGPTTWMSRGVCRHCPRPKHRAAAPGPTQTPARRHATEARWENPAKTP